MPVKRKKRNPQFPFQKILIALSVLLILSIALAFTAFKTLSIKTGLYEKVLFESPDGYSVKEVKQVNFDSRPFYATILTSNVRSSVHPPQIWIYEFTGRGYNLLSKISPTFARSEKGRFLNKVLTFNSRDSNYPDVPLDFISGSAVKVQNSHKEALLVRWGITGADFFGVFPTIISFDGSAFNFTPPYPKEFKEETILKSSYTLLPITIFNKNDESMKADTFGIMNYLNQGNSLVAEFLGSTSCRACANPKRVDAYVLTNNGVVYSPKVQGMYYLDAKSDIDKFVKDLDLAN